MTATHHERQIMHHHPDLLLGIAHEIQRSKIDAAARERLARSVRTPRRPFRARHVSLRRDGRVPWRQRDLVVQAAR